MKKSPFIDSERLPFPFCPGCSHGTVLKLLASSMEELELDPLKTVIVTDIGCAGLSDQWFTTHAFHGLHGRSVLYGEGVKLASPELAVIVIMGDGGAGIGAHHLLAAARRNIGITVLVFNNFNFGMTGGQHSSSTPEGSLTSSTPLGHREAPCRIAETMNINGAAYSVRRAFFDKDLRECIKSALSTDGFSLLEVLELCTAYYGESNRFKKSELEELMSNGLLPRVTLRNERESEYTSHIKSSEKPCAPESGKNVYTITTPYAGPVKKSMSLVVAGSAGQRVQSAVSQVASAAVASGLYAVQQDDYPVTVKTGYSVSAIKLSPARIEYPGMEKPDSIIIFTEEGLKRSGEYLSGDNAAKRVVAETELLPLLQGVKSDTFDIDHLDGNIKTDLRVLAVLYHFFIRELIIERDVLEKILLDSGKVEMEELEFFRASDPFD
jgi:pyruvate/2-oxoacid:ferredoxin oxidoreductase beta subunit